MIWFIFDLGIGLAAFVTFAVAFFRKPGAGLRTRNRPWARSLLFPANSLPDPVAGEMLSLLAAPEIQRKQLITLAIIDKTRPISALK